MDAESENLFRETSQSMEVSQIDQPETQCCVLCRRIISPDTEVHGLDSVEICGDCTFMFFEDLDATMQDSHRRRPSRGRRTNRYNTSESIEDLFSSQISQFINMVRQSEHNDSEHETQLINGDNATRLLQRTSSRTTPSGSRRWRRTVSDNESEGFDNWDSVFGDNDSIASFAGGYGTFHGESDTVSFSAYGGESDASVDGNGLLDREIVIQPDDGSYIDSDNTDIDPMHAGLHHWNSDEEDGEWEEANAEENTVETTEALDLLDDVFIRSPSENNNSPLNWLRELQSPENRSVIRLRFEENRRINFTNMEESPFMTNLGDYLDSRGFEQLLQQLAETESSRRGAPPAAASLINGSLPCVIMTKEHERHHGGLVCAVCKETISVGTEVNELPCTHFYHPSCILPWLSVRNSCPLCRFELPTDDNDYEEGKRNTTQVRTDPVDIEENDSPSVGDSFDDDNSEGAPETIDASIVRIEQGDSSSENCATGNSVRENGRGNWFFFAAAPIVSLVGIVLVLWFQNPLMEGRRTSSEQLGFTQQGHTSSCVSPMGQNQRENRNRRWWSFF
ncbi:hypothetical protein GIB67_041985 [Kingdonia uniflora]|uniref:RING-type domain-containing protein n=1 Tax=Kingdonia uniflora TaxID=39325 RepID=A0A7J7P0A5_9MAGN|nr:hypothetical protein GIB67_041985 [Kingdonia uniflora]